MSCFVRRIEILQEVGKFQSCGEIESTQEFEVYELMIGGNQYDFSGI